MQGTIKIYSDLKSYGYITAEDGAEVFFHISAFGVPIRPKVGQKVIFDLGRGPKGPTAERIRTI